MSNIVELRPTHPEDFWLKLEVSFEFLRDDGSSDLLRILMRDEYPKHSARLAVDTTRDPARWAMLRYALDLCRDSDEVA